MRYEKRGINQKGVYVMKIPTISLPSFSHLSFQKEPPEPKRRRKLLLCLFVGLLLFVGAMAAFFLRDYFAAIHVPPETKVNEAIANSVNAESYRFTLTSKLTVNAQERLFSVIQGEKSKDNAYHIQGTILGTEVNIYQIGDTTYRQDPIDQKWTVIEKTDMAKESLLLSELNPISNFYFNEIGPITPLEKDKTNRAEKKLGRKYAITPELANHWLEAYFTDMTYEIWVSKKEPYYLEKAIITAASKSNKENLLTMEIEFSDFNAPITITQPVLK